MNSRCTGATAPTIQGDLELRDVSFSYATRPDRTILNGVSLNIKSGQMVALVGASGSGKSTIIQVHRHEPDGVVRMLPLFYPISIPPQSRRA
jgi:ATP-binding cassette subfamily B (MDR/TAP) protein 1